MRSKSLILLALAGGCGIVASIGVSQVLDGRGKVVQFETVSIYVALHNINLGDPIDASMVSLQEWPKDKVPRGALMQLEDIETRRPRSAIIEGEPILEAKLLAPGQIADPISQIPKDMRLVTVPVDAETSAAGLLSPGDRVDIQLFVQRNPRHGIEEPKTKVILQNIRVYAVDQAVQRSADGEDARSVAKTISLLLTPEQAGKLHLAQKVGDLSLIPRNPDDDSQIAYAEVTLEDLLGDGTEGNSREKEQGQDDDEPEDDGISTGGLLSAIQSAIPEQKPDPPFRMEIVLADVVTEMLFDAETGVPVRTDPASKDTPGFGGSGGAAGPVSPLAPGLPSNDFGGIGGGLDDFPIDLDGIE